MTERRALLLLLALVALTHGLLAINTGFYWDDYMICSWLEERNWPRFYEIGDTMGNLGLTYLHWPFIVFPSPCAAMKVAVLLSLLGTACLIYLTAREIGVTDRFAAFFIAAAGVIYPGHMMTFAPNIAGHFYCYLAFALGAFCALRSESRAGRDRVAYRVAACLAFVVSYFTPSFLSFHFGFLLLLFMRKPERFLMRHADLAVLPFAYWALKAWLNPVHGWAAEWNYNAIRFDPDRMLMVYGNLLRVVGYSWLHYLEPFVACVAALSVALWLLRRFTSSVASVLDASPASARWSALAVAFGLVWLVLGAFPYAAVGKAFGAPAMVDWETRNQLLLQLPLGIFVLGIAGLAFGRWPAIRISALASVLLFCVAIRIDTYLQWEAQAIKDESIRYHLAQQAGKYQLLLFNDRYVIVDAGRYVNDIPLWWSYVLKRAFGDFTRFGLYDRDPARAVATRRYTPADVARIPLRDRVHPAQFDPAAPQAAVIIDRGPRAGTYSLIVPYYFAKLRGAEALHQFLWGVTKISLTDLH